MVFLSLCYPLLFIVTVITNVFPLNILIKASLIYPLGCSNQIPTCNSYLYHHTSINGLSTEQIASYYSVNTSSIKPITYGLKQDYLVSVPCSCKDVNGTQGYFYDTFYRILPGDTFSDVTKVQYSGQAWEVAGAEELFTAGDLIIINLLCGCTEVESLEIITYTVQKNDTLSGIAAFLSSESTGIENLNKRLTQSPSFIDVGWVLFVPREKKGIQESRQGKTHYLAVILALLSAATLLSVSTSLVFLFRRNRNHKNKEDERKAFSQYSNPLNHSFKSKFNKNEIEGTTFDSERPVVFSLEEINQATSNFDESRKIGEGGYGSVYLGMLKEKEVAVKKMKSSSSKEFFAELKVLCRIHHINVVELLGYTSGDNHLYLVYEYIQNGSLCEHLHDPLLKGNSPLSWTARANIALDSARGIEYIHDHTKARYVHRDIKTSNILLDQGLRAKVADFGLAMLVERSNDKEDFMATRLVGTPGYMAPESVRELQITSKTDVFAFGVVLAELITGERAIIRDNREPDNMKALASVMLSIFRDQEPEIALEANIDSNLRGSYPMEQVYKMAEVSKQCLSEDPLLRAEMGEIVQTLSQVLMSSVEWEASLGGSSPVFSWVVDGR